MPLKRKEVTRNNRCSSGPSSLLCKNIMRKTNLLRILRAIVMSILARGYHGHWHLIFGLNGDGSRNSLFYVSEFAFSLVLPYVDRLSFVRSISFSRYFWLNSLRTLKVCLMPSGVSFSVTLISPSKTPRTACNSSAGCI